MNGRGGNLVFGPKYRPLILAGPDQSAVNPSNGQDVRRGIGGLGHLVEEGIEGSHPVLRQQLQPVVQSQAGREVSSTWRKKYTNNYVTYNHSSWLSCH
jgi:hypothetical protein